MARSVADAALLLSVMAGSDVDDPASGEADARKQDYAASLAAASLKGKRRGVIVPDAGAVPSDTDKVFETAVAALKSAGAEIVEFTISYRRRPNWGRAN